ncbi:DUF421 domain-containing protein [Effusibacillus pohliae]|uniref:DUF421 domain-containing protein n=1 Tax=Effusibacillus pohliae TaxID=232270 RepID=UPI0003635387|nr:YetF domain-containing protein [Effusibacillus pohliae]
MKFLWEAVILMCASMVLLRIAGKKSVSQMTTIERITLLAIGTTMGHAIHESELWQTVVVLAVFVAVLIFFQFIQFRFNFLERILIGNATLVIHNGRVITQNLSKLRMTQNQLEMRLRQKGISCISDVKTATIEANGELGYELMEHAKPLTRSDLNQLQMQALPNQQASNPKNEKNIFEEIVRQHYQTANAENNVPRLD